MRGSRTIASVLLVSTLACGDKAVRTLPEPGLDEPSEPEPAPEPEAEPESEAEPEPDPDWPNPRTREIWQGWLSVRDEDRRGPDAERVGATCLLMDLQFMDAPLFRVRETVGPGARLVATLPGKTSEFDSTRGQSVVPGDLVLGSQVVEGSRCVYRVGDDGVLAAGFVADEHLERVPDPAPRPLAELVGVWAEGGWDPATPECPPDHFSISTDVSGRFVARGSATWCCGCDSYDTHFGGMAGTIEQLVDREGVVDGDCLVAFVQRGPFLIVIDDFTCGGLNVAFRGIYLRRVE